MRIGVQSKAREVYVPKLEGNETVEPGSQWRIVMTRPADWKLEQLAFKMHGNVKRFDVEAYLLMFIEFENAPELDIDEGESRRPMEPEDLFRYDVFADVIIDLTVIAGKMTKREGTDTKNS